jgi:hypothetical protein
MECNIARQLLAFRRSGGPAELAPEDAADLARHLAACPPCAAAARRQEAFDTAVATAMKGITVPSGLRDKLLTDALAKQGALLRRKIYSQLLVAATLFLGVALTPGIANLLTRQTLDSEYIANRDTERMDSPEQAVQVWLTKKGLPTDYLSNYDYALHAGHGTEPLGDEEASVVKFQTWRPNERRPDTARVFILRDSQFDTSKLRNTVGSFVTVTVIKSGRYTYVILHTAPLDVFLKPPQVPA